MGQKSRTCQEKTEILQKYTSVFGITVKGTVNVDDIHLHGVDREQICLHLSGMDVTNAKDTITGWTGALPWSGWLFDRSLNKAVQPGGDISVLLALSSLAGMFGRMFDQSFPACAFFFFF